MKKPIGAILALLLLCSHAQAQTDIHIGASAVASANDFATRAFQDPWDMNERTDLGWFVHGVDQPASGFSAVDFSGGLFTGVTSSTGNFFLLETGNPNAARLGKIGTNYPIDADTYRVLAFRMRLDTGNAIQLFWNRETIYDTTTTRSNNILTSAGDRIYMVDLAGLGANQVGASSPFAWGGTVKSLRFDATFTANTVVMDWVRLVDVDPSLCRTIAWTGSSTVDIYLDNDTDSANGHLGAVALGATASGAGSASPGCSTSGSGYKYYAGALAPGTYHVVVVGTGVSPAAATAANYSSDTWVVNDLPTVSFVTPSDEGSSDDFASTFLGNAWDMDAVSDFDLIQNVTSPQITMMALETPAGVPLGTQRVFKGTSAPASGGLVGDPYMDPLFVTGRGFNNRIDTERYRILTFEFGIPDKPRDILNGSIARIVWRVAGQSLESVSDDIIVNHRAGASVLNKIVVDMADRSALKIEQGAFTGGQGWTNGASAQPGLDIFRVDPHEFDAPTDFFVRRIKLAAFERVDDSYDISWTYRDASGAGTVALFYDSDEDPSNGMTQIAAGIATGTEGAYNWNTSGMPDGAYFIYASVSDGSNSNGTYAKWPVLIEDGYQPLPRIVVNRPVLNFGVTALTQKTGPQTVRVTVVGSGAPCWTVDNPLPAIFDVTNGSGCGNGSFTVSLVDQNYFALGLGETTLSVRATTPGTIDNSPQVVRAWYRILGSTTAPLGTIDTPASNTTVSGSIAVTGWVVDDIDVTSVEVFRAAPAAAGGEVRIGSAVRVDDARNDIAAAFPERPFQYRGGWGYLLLTNFLPGGGDGTYELRVYATDREGHRTLLGTRTIVGANSVATRPFGAIDTPTQGATVSGVVSNFGWVLARGPALASPALSAGATVNVVIDGVAVGTPCCWGNRSDLTSLFPQSIYPGVTHALGVYSFDSAAYANGVHTIAWGVLADNGQADGIGSRYFTIANGSGSLTAVGQAAATIAAPPARQAGPALGRSQHAVAYTAASGAVSVVRGIGRGRARRALAGSDGSRLVLARASERLEVRLPADAGTGTWSAYQLVQGVLRPLPIGSAFDERRGAFYWQPGLGFAGAFDFVFVRANARVPLTVLLDPAKAPVTASVRRAYRGLFAIGEVN